MAPSQLIVGLGNPGSKYEPTRHNIGFRAVDAFAATREAQFVEIPKYQAFLAEVSLSPERKVVLVKPQTFMNKSGDAVSKLARFYKLAPNQIWVVQDDIDLEIGRLRLKIGGGGDGGHNGIKSLEAALGSRDFARLKLGVAPGADDPRAQANARDLVLGKFSEHEEEFIIPAVLVGSVMALDRMLNQGLEKAASMMGT